MRLSSAQAEVVALAEHLSIPVATSVNGKATILDRHPLSGPRAPAVDLEGQTGDRGGDQRHARVERGVVERGLLVHEAELAAAKEALKRLMPNVLKFPPQEEELVRLAADESIWVTALSAGT